MPKYPIYLDLHKKRVVVIGAGPVAQRKVRALCDAGARVVVVSSRIDKSFQAECKHPGIELIISSYTKDYLVGALLVIAATNDAPLNRRIYEDCQTLEILCNVVDEPSLCDFHVPAVLNRGPLQIAVGTDGNCPAYAAHSRQKLEKIFTDAHGRFVEELEKIRKEIIELIPDPNKRKEIINKLVNDESFNLFNTQGPEKWLSHVRSLINES
jgi:precorrin-2 dehydrogenase/sirohydrochlorin ferrochelatase